MNALAIDCATGKLTVAAKNDLHMVKLVLDIGQKQSEKILPSVEYVMQELGLKSSDLDYTCITLGPGSFTGLRLGLSLLKALNLANGTPCYGTETLEAAAYQYRKSTEGVLAVLESKEDEYFNQSFVYGKPLSQTEDQPIEDIIKKLDPEVDVLICGPGAKNFVEKCNTDFPLYGVHCFGPENDLTESLFEITEKKIQDKVQPLQDYDGPVYVRKSEAEIVLEKKNAEK